MSWSFSTRIEAGEDPREVLVAERVKVDPAQYAAQYNALDESNEAVDAAIEAATGMVLAIRGEGAVIVQLSGHSNPEHKPVAGWSNDQVAVSVSQSIA